MQYFTKDLWYRINSSDNSVKEAAKDEWNKSAKEYQINFEKIKQFIPHGFLKKFLLRYGLHDYIFIEMTVKKNRKGSGYLCELKLTNGSENICLTMLDVKAARINVDSFQNCVQGKLAWGYSEFARTEDGTIRLSVICDIDNELQFEFKSIKLSKFH